MFLRCRLHLKFASIGGGLPVFRPGAAPLLTELQLDLPANAPCTLPPAWAAPGALPALQTLHVRAPLAGPLPREWAGGLPSLVSLSLEDTSPQAVTKSGGAASGGRPPGPPLPPGQAQAQQQQQQGGERDGEGGEQQQQQLGQAAAGGEEEAQRQAPGGGWPLPAEWADGFGALGGLELRRLRLAGPLPAAWAEGGFPSLAFL
jgi:hypothetical protein